MGFRQRNYRALKMAGESVPSSTPRQAKFMRAVAHGFKPKSGGPSVEVAKEFMHADEAKKKGSRSRVQRADRKRSTDEWARGGKKQP